VAKAWGVHRLRRKSAGATAAEVPGVPGVFDECAQFLGGQFLESYRGNRDSAPDWVWVNVLAHASEELLATCAATGGAPSRASSRCVWDRTLSFLAQVLLDHAGRTGVPVALLQRDIVVPIELRLGVRPLAPPTLVRLVLSGLQEREGPDQDRPAPTAPAPAAPAPANDTATTKRRA
jgi:hypothetical protein